MPTQKLKMGDLLIVIGRRNRNRIDVGFWDAEQNFSGDLPPEFLAPGLLPSDN